MVNKVILIGNVGTEPEVRALETGIKMARLRIATTERIYNASTGEKREHTEWHTVVLWRGQADFAEKYIRKGNQVYVEGKIRSREWTEEATGNKRHAVEILADEVRLLGQRRSDGGNFGEYRNGQFSGPAAQREQQGRQETAPPLPKDADGLPF
ncbi:single-stranded DNA-binding protein [uncultured Rikenella sp.]|uniref:single-stranded DNA-binding protein n=1 Tax=uncultured Rikenella sp. TaxID=368003 RepID=UPI00263523D1|nr:single-stranded DNA-binding protein [uncultured Rikenella sp.]